MSKEALGLPCYEIEAPIRLPDGDVSRLDGRQMDDSHFDVLLSGGRVIWRDGRTSGPHVNVAVRKPQDGSLLTVYRHDCLSNRVCRTHGYDVLKHVRVSSSNRAIVPDDENDASRFKPLKRDGTVSRTNQTEPVGSGIIGYYDRYPRMDYCRMTAFNIDHHAEFAQAKPFVRAVDRAFAEAVPSRHAVQQAIVQRTSPDFYIHDTVFSTITVNRNLSTALHQDKGDYAPGFGVMSVLEAGHYDGCYLVFPQYRVAVDMRTGGVCLADVHEWHGNTPIVGTLGSYVRLSLVFYYRTGMQFCGSAADELARVKRLRVEES